MYRKLFFLFLFVLILFNPVFAQEYADIVIDVSSDGRVSIDGTTNYEDFEGVVNSQKFTSKEGEHWIFNLSTNKVFDSYIYELKLPENSQINYVKSQGDFRIESKDGRVVIIGVGESEELNLFVQYKINYDDEGLKESTFLDYFVGGLIFIVAVLAFFLLYKSFLKQSKIKKNSSVENVTDDKGKIDLDLFTPRQQDILKILIERRKITQKEIEKILEIPKSSVSRNIRTLEIKGVITKERVGQTNYILLKN
jgi:DNA-binding MarR family transcriptional regulator